MGWWSKIDQGTATHRRHLAPLRRRTSLDKAPKIWSPRLILATISVTVGIVIVLVIPALPPSTYIFGKAPLIICLASLAPIMILAGWTVLKQGYSLRTLMIGILGAALLLSYARYQVVSDYSSTGFKIQPLRFVPDSGERARVQNAVTPTALGRLFDPIFMPESYDTGLGLSSVVLTWMNTVNEEDLGESTILVGLRYYKARHPDPERPFDVVAAYVDLKADCLTVDHATIGFTNRYSEKYGTAFPVTMTKPTKVTYPLTRDGALLAFRERVKDSWGDDLPFIQAIAERDPDPLLREAAEKLLESKKVWHPEPAALQP